MAIINGNELDNILSGSLEDDIIHGNGGNDSISGFGGADQLFGDAGRDTLDGGFAGTHRMNGGTDNDTYIVHDQRRDVISEPTTADGGIDSVDTVLTNYKLPSAALVENLFIHGLGDQATGVSKGEGNQLSNVITAQSGSFNHVSVFELKGYNGNDTIFGDFTVSNEIFGGNGSDTIVGGAKADRISGVDAFGDTGNLGTFDQDIIDVGTQSPTLGVRDTVVLGDERGAYYNGLLGFARVKNFHVFEDSIELAGTKDDYKVVVSQFADSANNAKWDLTIQKKGDTVAIFENMLDSTTSASNAQTTGDFLLQGAQYKTINTPTLTGTSSSNLIRGASAGGILDGKGGDDKLFSMGGNDIILGGTGDDLLNGGADNDVLWGGKGNDTLIGAQGSDTYVFAKGDGVDVIKGFQVGVDRIGFLGDVAAADISLVAGQGGTIVKTGSESLAVLAGINPNQVSLNDVVQMGTTQLSGVNVPTILG